MKWRSYVKCLLIISLLLISFSSMVISEEEYIKDTTGKIDKETIQTTNSRLKKLEMDEQIKVLIIITNNTDGKDIEQYTLDMANELKKSKYAIFVTSIEGQKNHFLVGEGIRQLFTKEDIDGISYLPNEEFKKGEFSKGIAKVESHINYYLYRKIAAEEKEKQQQLDRERYERLQREEFSSNLKTLLVIVFAIFVFGFPIYIEKRAKSKNKRKCPQNKRMVTNSNNKHRHNNSNYNSHSEAKVATYNKNNDGDYYSNNEISSGIVNSFIIDNVINNSYSSEYDSGSYSSSDEGSNESDNFSTSSWESDDSSNSSSSSWWGNSSSNDDSYNSNSSSDSSTNSWDSSSTSSWSSDSSSDNSSTSDW